MPIRICDIAHKHGIDSEVVVTAARQLGIAAAKGPTSLLDKITADYLEGELSKVKPKSSSAMNFAPVSKVSNANLPPSTIEVRVSGSEVVALAHKILSGTLKVAVVVLDERETESPLRLTLAAEVEGLQSIERPRAEIDDQAKDLFRSAYFASRGADGWANLAEYGNKIRALDPKFQPERFGEKNLASLLRRTMDLFEMKSDDTRPPVYYVRLREPSVGIGSPTALPQGPRATANLGRTVNGPTQHDVARESGKIHNVRPQFGFVAPDDGSENLFFHASDVFGASIFDLRPGDSVEYLRGQNEKGPCALKVQIKK